VYCKAAGVNRVQLLTTVGGSVRNAVFNIADGSVVSESSATGAIESVGNGFYRISITYTAPATTNGRAYLNLINDSGTSDYAGNGYNSVIASAFQFEQNAFPSSYIATSGSASTRTADSLSVATADIGYTGGPVTLFAESSTQTPAYNSNNRGVVDLSEPASSYNRVMIYNRGAQAGGFLVNADNVQQGSGFGGITDDSYTKVGVSVDTNSIKHCVNGGTVSTDTSAVIPDGLTKMFIGQTRSGSGFGGHIKRIYLYPESTTDTELQSLTS
jgi:hypothetical protein